jgi:hypothetical protein
MKLLARQVFINIFQPVNLTGSIFPHGQPTAKDFVKEITFVTASTNCNFLGYSVKFDDEITCKENL